MPQHAEERTAQPARILKAEAASDLFEALEAGFDRITCGGDPELLDGSGRGGLHFASKGAGKIAGTHRDAFRELLNCQRFTQVFLHPRDQRLKASRLAAKLEEAGKL